MGLLATPCKRNMKSSKVKPIFLIGVPHRGMISNKEPVQSLEKNIPDNIKLDYHVLFYVHTIDSDFKFSVLNSDNADNIDFEELKTLLMSK